MSEIWELDATSIADSVRSGDLKATEVLDTIAQRVADHDGALNALVYLDWDRARADAKNIDQRIAVGDEVGLLAGVPLGVKDLEDVEGMPNTQGSVPYKDNISVRDGVQTARLRTSGAVIVGKTAAPEFGTTAFTDTPLHGTTRNPWNHERTPGGSSGGSAAAVAAGILPIATASDGGGSTRIPASYSGLFGAKGTYGRIPRGDGPDASLTSLLGCVSRSVRDSARFWDCVVGHHERDPLSLPHPGLSYEATLTEPVPALRATWSDDLGFGACADEVSATARKAADVLIEAAGMSWSDTPVALKDMSVAWNLFGRPTRWLAVKDFWPDRKDEFTPIVQASVPHGEEHFTMRELATAHERRHENNSRLAEVFADVDVILTPTTATTAFRAEGPMPTEIDGEPVKPMHAITFTFPFNISGHPAFSVPCGLDRDGLPIGLQLVGRRHEDHVLFQLARVLEQTQPWPAIAPAYR